MFTYGAGRAGEWVAALSGNRLLVVSASGSPLSISGVWDSLGQDTGMQGVLDFLTAQGLFQTPSFALLCWEGSLADGSIPVHAIVRGPITLRLATAAGALDVSGLGVSTWIEQSFAAVSALEVECGPQGELPVSGEALPLVSGAAWVSRLSAVGGGPSVPVHTPGRRTAPLALSVPLPQGQPVLAPLVPPFLDDVPVQAAPDSIVEETKVDFTLDVPPAPEPSADRADGPAASESLAEPVAEPVDTVLMPVIPTPEPSAGATVQPPPAEPRVSTGQTPVVQSPIDASGYDHLFGATMMRGIEDAAVRPPDEEQEQQQQAAVPPAPESDSASSSDPASDPAPTPLIVDTGTGDHDGETVMSGDLGNRGDGPARAARLASAPSAPVPAAPYLLLMNGVHEPLLKPVLFGRSPSVSKVSGGLVPKLVSVGDGDQDISRNHAQFALEGDTVVVTDLHSRNGTMIVLPGKSPQKLRQGEPTPVIVGTLVDLGSGVTMTVCED